MAGNLNVSEVKLISPNGLQEGVLSINDSGVVSSTKPVTLANPTIYNIPVFKAKNSTGQSFISNVYAQMTLTEDYDTTNAFSNSRFTPTKAGYYLINGTVAIGVGATRASGSFYKNGVALGNAFADLWNVPSAWVGSGSTIVYMNGTTDYIELWAYVYGGTYTLYGELSGMYVCS